MRRVAVVGAGSWGTALAVLAHRADHDVTLWARRAEHAAALRADQENATRLPGIALDAAIQMTADGGDLAEAGLWLVAVPAQHLRPILSGLAAHCPASTTLVSCAKGIERGSLLAPSQVIEECLPGRRVGVLSGPSFAAEAARGLPTAVVIASADPGLADQLVRDLATGSFRPYASSDPIGVEIAGAAKNVLAIACGMAIGHGLGENARAALVTRGLAEIGRLVAALGGRPETLLGLAGIGDVALTCGSTRSRNYALGFALAQGSRPSAHGVAEGVETAEALAALAARHGVEVPIAGAVATVLAGRMTIDAAMTGLLARPLKREF